MTAEPTDPADSATPTAPTVDVLVVGSVNMDLAVRVARIPAPGETVLARGASRSPGGKGGNQAVAAARAGGAAVGFVGAVGEDADGRALREALAADGIDVSGTETVAGSSGLALISVDDASENAIVVVPGANAAASTRSPRALAQLAGARVVLAQLEIPLATVLHAATARSAGSLFVLNAAPALDPGPELLAATDVLVVNEHEARALGGGDDLDAAVRALLERVPTLVVTVGSEGAVLHRRGRPPHRQPAFAVAAVDSTSAGDAFCGVLAARLARGGGIEEALREASAAAALTVMRPGAQDAIPSAAEVRAFVAEPPAGPVSAPR
ncbi:ribokinase [Brachybacterium sp. DNPG3]